jgi:hypothetical protein
MPNGAEVDFGALDQIIATQQGVRGWLDQQDKLNRRLRGRFAEVLAPTEAQLDLAVANVLEAGKFATATEIKAREDERQALLGRGGRREGLPPTAAQFHEQANKSAQRALNIIRAASERLDDPGSPLTQIRRVHEDPDAKAAVEDARVSFLQAFVKFNRLEPENFSEVNAIWDEVVPIALNEGVEGLLNYTQRNLDDFLSVRAEDDRGNRPHSPLEWWKWVLIAVILAAGVFAVIACFWWFGCTWVWEAISAIAPWVFGIIDSGC